MTPDLAPALEILRRETPGLAAVYLFGSAASGLARADSDIDLAVLSTERLARTRVVELQQGLANALRREVDLVDLATAPTILQMQIVGEGRLVDAPDAASAAFFEVRVMRDYQELKARRADLEAEVIRRGRVYV